MKLNSFKYLLSLLIAIASMSLFDSKIFAQGGENNPQISNDSNLGKIINTERSVEVELFETKKLLDEAIKNKDDIVQLIDEAISEQKHNSIQLIDLANQIRKREFEIAEAEKRLANLQAQEKILRVEFADKKNLLLDLLVGLQKINQNRPPALLVSPNDILYSIRNAIVISDVIPNAESETREIAEKLARLVNIRNEIIVEQNQYQSHVKILKIKHIDIEDFLDKKKQNIYFSKQKLDNENQRIDILSSASSNLHELITKLKLEEVTQKKEYTHWLGLHNNDGNDAGDGDLVSDSEKQKVVTLLAQAYLKPEVPFIKTKGKLPFPVNGDVISIFGEDDNLGSISKGIYVKTKNYAQVISPASGWIEYSGKFRSYGKLLIINAGDDYHIILSGIKNLNVVVGQFIFSGEPVGVMGDRAFKSSTKEFTSEVIEPTLYIEIRKHGISLNPNDWWQEEIKHIKKS